MKKNVMKIPIQLLVLNLILLFKDDSLNTFASGKITEIIFISICNVIFLIASFIWEIFINPIHLEIIQKNKKFGTDNTFLSIDNSAELNLESNRMVTFTLKVERNPSIWSLPILLILNFFEPVLIVLPSSQGILLNIKNGSARNDSVEEGGGIKINLYQYISNILSNLSQGSVEKNLEYTPVSDPLNIITSEKIIINTKLSKNFMKNLFYSMFFRIKSNMNHTIYFNRS